MIDIFMKMSLLKQNDERMRAVIKSGRLVMPYYSYRGQEVIPSTISALLRDTDYICTIYRGTHDSLAKGCPVDQLWAELAGRVTGTCKGKGGPMHITHPGSGVMVTTGIVGSTMPIANGLAWGSKLKGNDAVTIAYFGDGASNIGAFHESLNLASLWKLPVVFVCSNNRYSEHTKTEFGTAIDQIARRAESYTMPGVRVDGNDVLAMHAAASEAIDRARAGEGPTLIEAMTFRFFGHVFGDDDKYMDEGEKAAAMQADPYPVYRSFLLDNGHADEAELAAIEAGHKDEIDAALQFALDSPFPEAIEVARDVYAYEVAE
ncbi:thiamine pyrophosphate-dependent dehydrogenase E1 component subunit alpha [uncultured Sphingomonas sp.]|uniref:thiamine pyrophosphate-dependent dehydrogenase E1 component subunit alpha n=1 Tax=uncultured Sphingomonas sp. TaxID=158754 RepID=UPI0035CA249E